MSGSLVTCSCRGSSVDRDTFKPLKQKRKMKEERRERLMSGTGFDRVFF
jgi:hypothetical protein